MNVMKWLGKLVISTVLISSISVFTAWYVVNLYVQEIFRQYQIPALGKRIQISEFAARLGEELNIVKPRDGGKQTAINSLPSPSPSAVPTDTPAASPSSTPTDGSQATQGEVSGTEDDSVAVMGRVRSESDSQKQDLVMSTEDFAKKKEQLTSEDKMKVFSLVVAKLPQNEVQHLSALLEDGITSDELKEVDQTLKKYLNDNEYKQLMDIISKY